MKILAVDTATNSCSVAIADRGRLLAETTHVSRQTHSRHLTVMIAEICRFSGVEIGDVDGYAVTRGPGSFTGLRIGISTVKGLAAAAKKPIIGISTLESLALQVVMPHGLICAVIDARRGELYYGIFRCADGELSAHAPETTGALDDMLCDIRGPCTFVGNGVPAHRSEIRERLQGEAHFPTDSKHIIRAVSVALLAEKRLAAKDTDDVAHFAPAYLRKSDAQISRGPIGFDKKVLL